MAWQHLTWGAHKETRLMNARTPTPISFYNKVAQRVSHIQQLLSLHFMYWRMFISRDCLAMESFLSASSLTGLTEIVWGSRPCGRGAIPPFLLNCWPRDYMSRLSVRLLLAFIALLSPRKKTTQFSCFQLKQGSLNIHLSLQCCVISIAMSSAQIHSEVTTYFNLFDAWWSNRFVLTQKVVYSWRLIKLYLQLPCALRDETQGQWL